jgi:hypothetical protein
MTLMCLCGIDSPWCVCGCACAQFFAVDLGGSNLRVVSVELDGRGGATSKELKATIPDIVMRGHGTELFDFVAELVKRADPPAGAPLGFTFSFPVDQKRLDAGELIQWTKGCVDDCLLLPCECPRKNMRHRPGLSVPVSLATTSCTCSRRRWSAKASTFVPLRL